MKRVAGGRRRSLHKERPLSPEEAQQQTLIRSAQILLHTVSLILGVLDDQLGKLASYFVDSPLREAMEEGEIPSDVPTALQEAVDTFRDTLRSLRTSVDEAVRYTPASLLQHWRRHQLPKGALAGERAKGARLTRPDATPR